MKIISSAREWSKQYVCPHCESTIEVDEEDKIGYYISSSGLSSFEVNCPQCYSLFPLEDLPFFVRFKFRKVNKLIDALRFINENVG